LNTKSGFWNKISQRSSFCIFFHNRGRQGYQVSGIKNLK